VWRARLSTAVTTILSHLDRSGAEFLCRSSAGRLRTRGVWNLVSKNDIGSNDTSTPPPFFRILAMHRNGVTLKYCCLLCAAGPFRRLRDVLEALFKYTLPRDDLKKFQMVYVWVWMTLVGKICEHFTNLYCDYIFIMCHVLLISHLFDQGDSVPEKLWNGSNVAL